MTREEMLEKMRAANQNGASKLHMRAENIQNRMSVRRLPILKKALKKKSKLLLVCDLAIPFNPETGEEDDTFNADNKYRPPFSATTVALAMKELANENPAAKEAFLRRAGVQEWDTSDVSTFTKQDWQIFAKYRVPRIFTVPVVHINIPVLTNNNFGTDYSISVERDPLTGEVVGEVPGVLKVDKLFRDKIYEEIQEFNGRIDSGELKLTEKQAKDMRSDIYKKNPVSSEHPSNWVMLVELPVDNKYQLSGDVDYKNITPDVVKEHIVISRLSAKIRDTVNAYMRGELEKFDEYFDYFVLDMGCPVEGDDTTEQGRMILGKDTTYEKPSYTIEECLGESAATLKSAITGCLDDYLDVEEEVRRSMYIPPYTEDVESRLYTALPTVLDIENDKYVTQAVMKANSEVISLAFTEVGDSLLDELDAGCSDAAVGSLDEEASARTAKKYSIEQLENEGDSDLDSSLDLVDVALDVDGLQ